MNNAEKFKQIFGLYATELWSMPEGDFLAWLNRDVETSQIDHTAGISKKVDGDDCISRRMAIDAVEKAKMAQTPDGEIFVAKYNAEMNIQLLPSVQPEIIRCKDCKYRYLDGMIWNCPFGLSGGEDFFCAYGAIGGGSGT